MPFTRYVVVRARSFTDLEKRVNRNLTRGWEPIGGLVVVSGYVYQAMGHSQHRADETTGEPESGSGPAS